MAKSLILDLMKCNNIGELINNIGSVYFNGDNGVVNVDKALDYFMLSIREGYNLAYGNAGACYLKKYFENSDKKHLELALLYSQQAVDKGDTTRYNNLGYCYENSNPPNHKLALKYYRLGVENKDMCSMNNLADMYSEGIGVEQDYEKVMELYQQAAGMGSEHALNKIGRIFELGLGVTKSVKNAINFYHQAADKGQIDSLFNLGAIYRDGYENEKIDIDYKLAHKFFSRAADKNHRLAMNELGLLYCNGTGVTKNLHRAFEYFSKAAELKDGHAIFNLGVIFDNKYDISVHKTKCLTCGKLSEIEPLKENGICGKCSKPFNVGFIIKHGCKSVCSKQSIICVKCF